VLCAAPALDRRTRAPQRAVPPGRRDIVGVVRCVCRTQSIGYIMGLMGAMTLTAYVRRQRPGVGP